MRDATEPRNILLVSMATDMYGAERSLLEIIEHLDGRWRPYFVLPGPGRFQDAVMQRGFPVFFITLKPSRGSPWLIDRTRVIIKLARLIRREQIRLVHLNHHYGARVVAAACSIARVPLVVHIRNMIEWPVGRLLDHVDGIICISQAVRDSLCEHGRSVIEDFAGRLWIIPDARDLCRYPGARQKVRKELGVDDRSPLVGMVARITPMKGQDVFLQTAAIVARAVPSARFLIVGGPDEAADVARIACLKQMQSDFGLADSLTFAGYRNDIPDVLAALDCFVHPSQRGAFVSVLIEAMATGVPIVASDVDGIPECVGRDGAAVLLKPASAEACADAVVRILRDEALAARMSTAGRHRASALYSASELAETTAAVFETVAAA